MQQGHRSSTFRGDIGKRMYSFTAKRMISGEVLKYLNGESCVIRKSLETNPADLRPVPVTAPART